MARNILFVVCLSLFLSAFSLGDSSGARAAGKPLLVIVSSATPLKDISTALLRRAFQGEAVEYATGKRLIPVNQPLNSLERIRFDRRVLSLKPEEVGRFWVDRRIRDQSGPPKAAPSTELALRLVMSLPGAISYISSDQLNDKVRALSIDGKSPDKPDYLLAD